MAQRPNRIQPMEQPKHGSTGRTLAAVVGISVAVALGVSIPEDESGRKVSASVDPGTNQLVVRHISGRQYLSTYLDIVGVPTACDGLTRDAEGRPLKRGQRFTEAQCSTMLEQALVAHATGVMNCSPGLAQSIFPVVEKERQGPRFAAVSLAYNVGVNAYCGSTARKRFNEGRYREGCDALLRWNKAGGRVVRGLVLRREREREVCLKGLS